MGLLDFNKLKEPVFLKEDSSAKEQLEQLEQLLLSADKKIAPQIEQDIRNLKAGIVGEDNIIFELKNSHIPMYVLHDIYVEDGELTAQIDFIVVTRKLNFFIECKNLYGNIEINHNGDFIRTTEWNGKKKREGLYSPITQNQRHLALVRSRIAQRKSPLIRALYEKCFATYNRSVVVLANPKTVLSDRFAPKDIKAQTLRADQLIQYIKSEINKSKELGWNDKELLENAEAFLSLHTPSTVNYFAKYQTSSQTDHAEEIKEKPNQEAAIPPAAILPKCPKCGADMILRTVKKGTNAGESFYGCANFPKCRGIINNK